MVGEDRRRQIIEVAAQVFSERGFAGATTRQIAEAAGVSEAMIFRHFARKEDLYTAILDRKYQDSGRNEWHEEIRELAGRREDEKLFRAIVAGLLRVYDRDPSFERLALYSSLERHEYSKLLASRRDPFFSFLRDYVATRQREGAFREGDPGLMIFSLLAMTLHYAQVTKLFEFDFLGASDDQAVDAFSKIMLNGIRKPGTK